jgi:hypothetical protein
MISLEALLNSLIFTEELSLLKLKTFFDVIFEKLKKINSLMQIDETKKIDRKKS